MKTKLKGRQNIYKYSFTTFKCDIEKICEIIQENNWNLKYIYGPPRGGCIIAVFLSHKLNLKYLSSLNENHIPSKTLIVDDVSDTGNTLSQIPNIRKYKTATLFIKPGTVFSPLIFVQSVPRNVWIQYFWEKDFNT